MPKKPFAEKTKFGKFLTFRWLKKAFSHVDDGLVYAALKITNGVKEVIDSPVLDWVTTSIKGDLDDKLLAGARKILPKIIAAELLLPDIIEDPTQEEIEALGAKIREAFGGLPEDKKGKFFTSVCAEISMFFHEQKGTKITFGEAAHEGEKLWKMYKEFKEAA